MKNKLISIIAPAVFFCWCLFLLQGCKKDPIIEDTDLLTSDDNLSLGKDTLHTKVFSEFVQPVVSSGVSNGVLGTLTDPNFGTTVAGFYAQCHLTSSNVSFGEPVLDSVVLSLKYNGLYGKFDQPVTISAFEIAEIMSASTKYYTNTSFQVGLPAIGQVSGFVPNTTDSVVTLNGTLEPHLRIKLSEIFGTKILTADSGSILVSDSAFQTFFKGVYVTSSSSTGNGLMYINLISSISGITLFYHNNTNDSLSYILPITSGGVRVNHIDNIYSGTPVNTSVNSPNASGEEKLYLESGAGTRGKIFITDFDSLPKNIAINKAELVLSQSPSDTTYTAPGTVYLYRIDDAGQIPAIDVGDDDDGTSAFTGSRITETVEGKTIVRYRFNCTKYLQRLLQGIYHNNGFILETYSNCERVVIANSSSDKNYQLNLVVTYTKL